MADSPTREAAAEILASVMKQHRTVHDLLGMLGGARSTVEAWLAQFHRSGVFYIVGWHQGSAGRPLPIYGMQPRPFLMRDAKRPPLKDRRRSRRTVQ
jgi:hypothetical protein